MKRIFSLVLVLALLLLQTLPATAEESLPEDLLIPSIPGPAEPMLPEVGGGLPPSSPDELPVDSEGVDLSGGIITSLSSLPTLAPRQVQYGDASFNDLKEELASIGLNGICRLSDINYSVCLDICWNYDELDASYTEASQTLTGEAQLPEGVTLGEGVSGQVSLLVQVMPLTDGGNIISPEAIVITGFEEQSKSLSVAVEVNDRTSLEDFFHDLEHTVTAYDGSGNTYRLQMQEWSTEDVDISKAGVYQVKASPDLGDGYVLKSGVTLTEWTYDVSVQANGKPDINCCTAGSETFIFPWILTAEQKTKIDEFTVWIKKNMGDWNQQIEGVDITEEGIVLSNDSLENGSTYTMQVDYPGGKTAMVRFVFDGGPLIVGYSHGDRDGGGDGSSMPSLMQPVPSNPQEQTGSSNGGGSNGSSDNSDANSTPEGSEDKENNDIKPQGKESEEAAEGEAMAVLSVGGLTIKPGMERDTTKGTVFSGTRILTLIELGEELAMRKGDAIVYLPVETLKLLDLTDEDLLTLTLTAQSENTISLLAYKNGNVLSELPGLRVATRYAAKEPNAIFIITDKFGTKIGEGSYETGLLTFIVDVAGTYTIVEESAVAGQTPAMADEADAESPMMIIGIIILAILALGTGVVFGLRRRAHR